MIGLVVTAVAYGLTFDLERRLADRQEVLEDLRADRQERLENLRFIRERADPSSRKPFSGLDLRGLPLRSLDFGCDPQREGEVEYPAQRTQRERPPRFCAYFFQTRLNRSDLTFASFVGAWLLRADLSDTQLREADFTSARIVNSTVERATLQYATFHSASVGWSRFGHSDLRGANFTKARANSSDFSDAQLQYANLQDTQLLGTSFAAADLRGADFSGADLREADLSGADLSGAVLKGAQLDGANLAGADFSAEGGLTSEDFPWSLFGEVESLPSADLTGADLSGTDLSRICYDRGTLWPEKRAHPQLPAADCGTA